MSPQRLVAAVAALAIGFGVTLVGVVVDDGEEIVVTAEPEDVEVDEEPLDEPEPDAGVDEPAEQEEEAAAEPEPAEVEAPVTTPASPQSQDAPSNPAESAPATTVPIEMEVEETDDSGDFDFPQNGVSCEDVVTIPTSGGAIDFVFVDFDGESSVLLLGRGGARVVEVPIGFVLDVEPREVRFDDGLPVEFGASCDEGDSFEDEGGPIGGGEVDGSIAPCDGVDLYGGALEIDEALSPQYGDVLASGDTSDLAGYRFLVAATAERAAAGSFFEFLEAVESTTSEFRTDCPFDVDSFLEFDLVIDFFIDDDFSEFEYDQLLCNLGRLSADSRLIDFLTDRAQAFDTINCDYAEET